MDDTRWERAAAAGGILFVVLALVSAFLPGSPPMASDPAREIAEFFADKSDQIRVASFLGVIASIPLVWWGASIFRMLERSTGNARLSVIAAIGIAVGVAASGVASVVFAVVGILGVEGSGGPDAVKFFFVLGLSLNGIVGIATALLVGAVSAGVLRTGMMAKGVGWFGALVALLAVAGSIVTVSVGDAAMGLSFLSFLAFALWLLIVSVVMLRRPATA